MKRTILSFVIALSLTSCGKPRTLAEEFPGDWQEPTTDVAVALAKKQITGCGEFYQKTAAFARDEYVVACSSDGKTWIVYRVWPRIEEVMGPDLSAVYKLGGPPNSN